MNRTVLALALIFAMNFFTIRALTNFDRDHQ